VRANDKVAEDAKDAKHGNVNRVVCGGVYGEGEGVETVVLKWDHDIFSGIPLDVFIESVFHSEPWWVPDAAHTNVSVIASGRDYRSCHSPQPLTYELGAWARRECWLGDTGVYG